MKTIFTTIFFIAIATVISCSKEQFVDTSMLQLSNDFFYLKSTDQLFTGSAVSFFENGQKKSEQHVQNGVLSGLVKNWYPNGNIKSEESFKDNLINGKNIFFHESGEIKLKININDSLLEGTFYYQEGDYIYNAFFSNGILMRSEIQYQLAENTIIQTYADNMLLTQELSNEGEIIETTQKSYYERTSASASMNDGMLAVSFTEAGLFAGRLIFQNGEIIFQENYVNEQLDILLYHDRGVGNRIYHCYYADRALESGSDEICTNLPIFN
jgi:antitoxin component YwqK of YwqJK toxin-antitoxin module